eukprot:TRINITY_DN10826_c0_g1_i1.p1 TRINITY_DN10826_c0_g1~~TRINITY_DN10826_c0_g1_i1.p1  ORF type:complete len:351 (+),score=77.03 TRINITY_DN10826_c0_g1_i1:100-1152(+)
MSLAQAAVLGHRASVAIIAETRSKKFGAGDPFAPEWKVVCRGTGFLAQPLAAAFPHRFHVVTCGHVALPLKFQALYGDAGQELVGLEPKDMRVRVEVRGDAGSVLFSALARPRKYAAESLMDDIAVLHLAPQDEATALTCKELAGASTEVLALHPGNAGCEDGVPPLTPGDPVSFSTYALLRGNEVYQGHTARSLHENYAAYVGDIAARRGDLLQWDTPYALVPTVHHGRVHDAHKFFTAVTATPQTMSAHSGSGLVHVPSGRVVGHLVRFGLGQDPKTKQSEAIRIRPGAFAPGAAYDGALDDAARLKLEEGYLSGCGFDEMSFFTPLSRLRAFLKRVEKAVSATAAKA